jgi:hypothetical protein
MKTCKVCDERKPLTDFYDTGKDAKDNYCKKCRDIWKYAQRRKNRIENGQKVRRFTTRESRELLKNGLKYCPGCNHVLEIDSFSTMKCRGGIASHCRKCSNAIARKRSSKPDIKRKRHDEYLVFRRDRRNYKLQLSFGITLEKYEQMLKEQGGVCAICKKTPEENGKSLAVDHCHETNKVRGLLCNNCNVAIGFLGNSQDIAHNTIAYLDKFEKGV